MRPLPRVALVTSTVSAVLAGIAAVVGVFYETIYRDEVTSFATQAHAQDMVTLAVVVPLLLVTTWRHGAGSVKIRLVWLGTLCYLVYTYLMAAVGLAHNELFLVYVGAYSTALVALVAGLARLDLAEVRRAFGPTPPRHLVGIYSILAGAALTLVWGKAVVQGLIDGAPPSLLDELASSSLVVQAMDLGLMAPLAITAGVLLLRDHPLGYLLGAIMMTKVATLLTAVWAMALLLYVRDAGGTLASLGFVSVALLVGLVIAVRFFLAGSRPSPMATPASQEVLHG